MLIEYLTGVCLQLTLKVIYAYACSIDLISLIQYEYFPALDSEPDTRPFHDQQYL